MIYDEDFEKFKAENFHELANDLFNKLNSFSSENKSSIIRTIVNRSYYSSFLCLREWLKENTGHSFSGAGDHGKIRRIIKKYKPFKHKNKDIKTRLYILSKTDLIVIITLINLKFKFETCIKNMLN